MKDISKFQKGMDSLFADDAKIRAALKKYDLLFSKPRELVLNEAADKMDHRKKLVLNILKKLFSDYQNELSAAVNIIGSAADKIDRALTVEKKLRGAA